MADVFSKSKRSEVMARIRSRGNKNTELVLARLLRAHGITGWRRQITLFARRSRREEDHASIRKSVRASSPRLLRANVDFVFQRARLAVFVDGCFWHGCPKHATKPKGNALFWRRKFAANKKRDELVNQSLRRAGWRVVRIWECDLKKCPETCVRRIQRALG